MENVLDVINSYKDEKYYINEKIAKIMLLMYNAGIKKNNEIAVPTLLIKGKPGGGKTSLCENFAKISESDKLFMQCVPGMGVENFQLEPNLEAILKQDSENAINKGILIRAIEKSNTTPVVVILDEIDKTRSEVDSFLLDFIQNGRVSTGTAEYYKGNNPIWLMITSNDERELSEALENRCRKLELPRMEKELFLECLDLPSEHYLGYIYDKDENFSLRQAYQYMNDIKSLDVDYDEDALKQYISIDEIYIESLKDLEDSKSAQKYIDNPEFERATIRIANLENSSLIMETIDSFEPNELDIEILQKRNRNNESVIDVVVEDAASLAKILNKAKQIDKSENVYYSGWVKVDKSDLTNVMWCDNLINNSKLGVKFTNNDLMLKCVSSNFNGEIENLINVDSSNNQIFEIESVKDILCDKTKVYQNQDQEII
ncbi:MAG: MoxR family ATPase [Clostridia bacterium]